MGCSGVCGRCVCLCLDSGDGHTGRTMHDLRQFGRARPDPVLLDCAHEPVWLYLCLLPIVNQTAAHAPLLRREHERPPCLHRYQRPTGRARRWRTRTARTVSSGRISDLKLAQTNQHLRSPCESRGRSWTQQRCNNLWPTAMCVCASYV